MRNNTDRVGAADSSSPAAKMTAEQLAEKLSFVTPTEHVELPSRGLFYAPNHPLHGQETIEIRHMTAKEEDILTSRALLKKGLALDRVLQNIIVDKRIDALSLISGDRNAIIMATRIAAYGPKYDASVSCPSCGDTNKFSFFLDTEKIYHGEDADNFGVRRTDSGTFLTTLPTLGFEVEFRLMNGRDEKQMLNLNAKKRDEENNVSKQLHTIIVSVEGLTDRSSLDLLIEKMPSSDARHVRTAYRLSSPNIDTSQTFECASCEYTQDMEVPMTADFFWPDR